MKAELTVSFVDFFPFIFAFRHLSFPILLTWKCLKRKILDVNSPSILMMRTMILISAPQMILILAWFACRFSMHRDDPHNHTALLTKVKLAYLCHGIASTWKVCDESQLFSFPKIWCNSLNLPALFQKTRRCSQLNKPQHLWMLKRSS